MDTYGKDRTHGVDPGGEESCPYKKAKAIIDYSYKEPVNRKQ